MLNFNVSFMKIISISSYQTIEKYCRMISPKINDFNNSQIFLTLTSKFLYILYTAYYTIPINLIKIKPVVLK